MPYGRSGPGIRGIQGRPELGRGARRLEVPPHAVVVPGSRAITRGWGQEQNLAIYTPVIVKYRDSKTETSIRLEDLLR